MKTFAILAIVALSASYVLCQESTTTEAPTTAAPTTAAPTTAAPTTANPGVQPGGICNGLLLRCDTHGNTVHCVRKFRNETIGGDACEEGIGVDLGTCQCQRNCKADHTFEDLAEWDRDLLKCVGLVGKPCSILLPDCTAHATCNLLSSTCACQSGYKPDASGLRCIPA